MDITLSSEAFHNYVNAAMVHINRALKLIVRLFLVEDLVDSLKVSHSALSRVLTRAEHTLDPGFVGRGHPWVKTPSLLR